MPGSNFTPFEEVKVSLSNSAAFFFPKNAPWSIFEDLGWLGVKQQPNCSPILLVHRIYVYKVNTVLCRPLFVYPAQIIPAFWFYFVATCRLIKYLIVVLWNWQKIHLQFFFYIKLESVWGLPMISYSNKISLMINQGFPKLISKPGKTFWRRQKKRTFTFYLWWEEFKDKV